MESLCDEILLEIFSFLPPGIVFKTVSLVCRRFWFLAYDSSTLRRSRGLLIEIKLQRKSFVSIQRLLDVVSRSPSNYVEFLSVQECNSTWEVFEKVAVTCKDLKILNLPGMNGVPNFCKDIQPFVFHQLLELNVSGTAIGDIVIEWVWRSCKDLYSLNISPCPNITDTGLSRAKFNLTLLNIAHCNLGFPSILHALREFDVQVLCIQGIHITVEESVRLDSMFPGCSEIGVPKICGFSLPDFESLSKNSCFWCTSSTLNTFLDSKVDLDTLYQL